MKPYLLNLWDSMRTSYWFVPSLFCVGALLFSFIMPAVDAILTKNDLPTPRWMHTTSATARATLSAMAGAMVAVTGTVFSITVVTLSLTSQQFGPRLLRRFMYDLPTQVTLGVFLSTGFYCLLLLRLVEAVDDQGKAVNPDLSVMAAVALTVLSMAMLIVFLHRIATLIQAPHVVAAVARDLDEAITRLFPEKIGQPADDDEQSTGVPEQEPESVHPHLLIRSTREGYIQAVDDGGLMSLARKLNVLVRLHSRPGHFMAIGRPLADFVFAYESRPENGDAKELTELLNETIIVGMRRTPRQDVECAIDELVEVAVRSLSPGINDPFTAINCIDRLGGALGRLAERKLPTAYRCDDEGRLRIIAHPVSLADALDTAFNQIRQYGRTSVAVTIRLLEALASVGDHVRRNEDWTALKQHADMILRHIESFSEDYDRQAVRAQYDKVTWPVKCQSQMPVLSSQSREV